MPQLSKRARQKRRLLRQFAVMERRIPALRWPLRMLLRDGGGFVRLPFAVLLMLGGLLSVLPFLGVWMLPLGLLLLAVDVPALRPGASALVIYGRRWSSKRLRRLGLKRGRLRPLWPPRGHCEGVLGAGTDGQSRTGPS